MEDVLKVYEKTIKKKHSVNFTPKYKEEFKTNVNKILFIAIAEKTVGRLGWDLIYVDGNSIEAKRKSSSLIGKGVLTEAISASFEFGNVVVKSESLGGEMWDRGNNSKRVKLFIYAYEETLKTFDKQSLQEFEKEIEKKNNWDDYIIPETLPKPIQRNAPIIALPIIGGLLISLILGFALAFISVKGIYIIGVFEILVAYAITFAMKYLIKISNFTDLNKLYYILAAMIILIFVLNQYFQYEMIFNTNNLDESGFLEFLTLKFSQGLIIETFNTGWIGLLISWMLQLGLTGLVVYLKIVSVLITYVIERVPNEVVDFAYYHFVKEKTEDQVRNELAKKGWSEKMNQDEVFEAIGGFQSATELNRIK
jgi:hypothetical protein